jgi:hypothetical protein
MPEPEVKFLRKVIRIEAVASPNVRLALAEIAAGKKPSHRELVPGVLSYREYRIRRKLWDPIKQCIALDAKFYEGSENLLFPPIWLNGAEERHREIWTNKLARPSQRAIGIDPAEGGDKTTMCCGDHFGILEMKSKRTPDTSMIVGEAIAFARKWGVEGNYIIFDRGGGGKQHADLMRRSKEWKDVRTIAFGEAVALPIRRGLNTIADRVDTKEERSVFFNMRAQLYGELSERIDPSLCAEEGWPIFAIPSELTTLRSELAPIPKMYDGEGKMRLPPKHKKTPDSKEISLCDLIGHSPDEGDATALMLHALLHPIKRIRAGVAFKQRFTVQ